ncbi:aldose 1-epimerase family protein [Amycolatopsis nigrescens]|uniref:aldose 1-epimerase family protein n=1 Tax=Amycolatopsis nigrescens TaxID=381445 RepID=UPI0003655677|nr:aldose 1-epimerase family protein [Amycolatopsis nigrescens]
MSSNGLSRRGAIGAALAAGAVTAMAGTARAEPAATGNSRRQTASGRIYELRRGRQRALVGGVAGSLLSYQVDGEELLLTHPPEEMGEGYQGKTILPWCNRIDHGRYTFEGEEYSVPINEPDRDTALHGLLSFTEWEPVRERRDSVVLGVQQHPHYGYPFHLRFRIEFALDSHGLSCTLTAHNIGTGPAPYGTANHTYIKAASGTIDTIGLELGASTYYLVNDRLIPTGTAPVAGTPYDFRTAKPIGATKMDTAFKDLRRGPDGLAAVGFTRPGGQDVQLWMDSGYGYLQVYTDDGPQGHPPRSGLTVEPVSCAPNCFNTGDGLVVLKPGQEWTGAWGLRTT